MFNPKERLEQIRKSKHSKEETPVSHTDPATPPPPLFQPLQPEPSLANHDLLTRLSRLENQVGELSSELSSSKDVVNHLRRENSEL